MKHIVFACTLLAHSHISLAATIAVQQNDFELNTTGLRQGHASVGMINTSTSGIDLIMTWKLAIIW